MMVHRIWRYLVVFALLAGVGAHAAQEPNLTIDTPGIAHCTRGCENKSAAAAAPWKAAPWG